MFVLCFLFFYPVVLTVMPIVLAFNFQSVWVANHSARRRGLARQLTCRDAGAALRFVTKTGQSVRAQGEFYEW